MARVARRPDISVDSFARLVDIASGVDRIGNRGNPSYMVEEPPVTTAEIISQLTTSLGSIIGIVTTSIITIRAHTKVTQAVIAANPTTPVETQTAQKLGIVP